MGMKSPITPVEAMRMRSDGTFSAREAHSTV